jgi:multicomponent Na+:H+ antiporter subunit G
VSIGELATLGLGTIGILFFLAGTVGLLRFPDVYSRLHGLTKADNLGLGFIVLAVLLQVDQVWLALKLVLVWMLAILAAATMSQLVARAALTGTDRRPRRGER